MHQGENGKLHVSLYLHMNNKLVNINEILIREKYACVTASGKIHPFLCLVILLSHWSLCSLSRIILSCSGELQMQKLGSFLLIILRSH